MIVARSFHVGGVRLHAFSGSEIVAQVSAWCRAREVGRPRTVCLVNAYSVASASTDDDFRRALNDADLSIADGVPVAWLGRRLLDGTCDRLSGPDLMHEMLSDPVLADIRHFVFGGEQSALDRLEFRYTRGGTARPRRIVGTWAPPFRELTPVEEAEFVARLGQLRPDIVWVCLGTARQEKWMARMRHTLNVPVMVGVGAAVDFLSGNKPRAPRWMQRSGLEWLFRLVTEPRRLWRRYLIGNLVFMRLAAAELWRRRTVSPEQP